MPALALDIATPRTLSDAVQVLADPDRYAHRPTLLHFARLTAMSAAGQVPRQRHRDPLRDGGAS